MRITSKVLSLLALACLTFCAIGCGDANMASLTGKLTIDGEPVEGINITFDPAEGSEATSSATGLTDAEGNYEAKFSSTTDGIMLGKYLVLVDGDVYDEETGDPVKSYKIPAEWSQAPTHEVEVTPGSNEFNIEITTK